MPTRDVLFENIEVRNGHGLTLGSEASGGMLNITYRSIFINGKGGPQAPGLRKRPGRVTALHTYNTIDTLRFLLIRTCALALKNALKRLCCAFYRHGSAVGGIHFKTGRGRGGHWENITWENIYGNFAIGLFGFAENHGR